MILYLFKTILCSGLLLVTYHLLLQREKMLHFSRFYLLFSLLFSFVIPLIHFSVPVAILLQPEVIASQTDAGILVNVVPENNLIARDIPVEEHAFNWWYIVLAIYTIGCGFLLFCFCRNLLRLIATIRNNEVQHYNGAKLVLLNSSTVPHSFFRFIFLSKEAYENGGIEPEVACHELTHVRQQHSLDIIWMELLIAICWFNPVLYFYRKAIRLNHEFLADEAVVKKFDNAPAYQYLLLQTAVVPLQPCPASSFNYSITQKRFLMMTKNTSPQVAVAKGITVFSLLTIAVLIFSTRTMAQVKDIPIKKQQDTLNGKTKPLADEAEQNREALVSAYWEKQSVGHTEEGATEQQLQAYEAIINKYKTAGKWWHTFSIRVTEQDRGLLENIFKQMNFAQQSEQFLIFMKPSDPLQRVVPTKAQLETFKNPKVYGLWVNGKHVGNTALNKYTNTDFSQFFVSKLYGPAKTGRGYTHQLDMMTNEYYQAYYDKTTANRRSAISFVLSNHPVDSVRQKFRSLNGKPRFQVQRYSSNKVKVSLNSNIITQQLQGLEAIIKKKTSTSIITGKRKGVTDVVNS